MRTLKYILAGMMALMTSCGEDFVTITNPNQLTQGSFWKSETDAIQASTAMYQALIYDGTYMRFGPWIMDVRADDALSVTPGYYPEDVANYIVDANNIAYSFPGNTIISAYGEPTRYWTTCRIFRWMKS